VPAALTFTSRSFEEGQGGGPRLAQWAPVAGHDLSSAFIVIEDAGSGHQDQVFDPLLEQGSRFLVVEPEAPWARSERSATFSRASSFRGLEEDRVFEAVKPAVDADAERPEEEGVCGKHQEHALHAKTHSLSAL
jgi:hypothetical protein